MKPEIMSQPAASCSPIHMDSSKQAVTFTEKCIEALHGTSSEFLSHPTTDPIDLKEDDEALPSSGNSDFINEAMLVSRLRALALHFMGCDVSQIARTVGYSRASVVRWLEMWESKNLHGLLCVPRRFITPEAGKALLSAYRAGSWKTSEEGSQWLSKNTGIHVSHVTIWRFAKVRGISFRRPKNSPRKTKYKIASQIGSAAHNANPVLTGGAITEVAQELVDGPHSSNEQHN